MVDIRTLLRNQEAKLRQQRIQLWKETLAKQDKEFVDKVVKANRDLIWNHVALLHEIKCEIAAQLGEDTAAELVPEDCTAGTAEKLLDAIVEGVVSGYVDGDGEGRGGGDMAQGRDGNMADQQGESPAVEMDVDEPDAGSASGHGLHDSEAVLSRVASLYEEHISSMSKSASPKPWTREMSSDDVQIVEAEDVPVHIKGEREDTAALLEISRSSPGLPRSMSSFSPDIQSKGGVRNRHSRATASRAGGIGASRPVGFEVSPPPRC